MEKALKQEGTFEVARKLSAAGLPVRTISMRGVGAWVMTVLVNHLPAGESTDVLAGGRGYSMTWAIFKVYWARGKKL